MSHTETIRYATVDSDNGQPIHNISGQVAWISIPRTPYADGDQPHFRFKALVVMNHGRPINVTHYASGLRIARCDGVRSHLYCANGKPPSPQAVARETIRRLVHEHGAEEVIGRIMGASVRPHLNPDHTAEQ